MPSSVTNITKYHEMSHFMRGFGHGTLLSIYTFSIEISTRSEIKQDLHDDVEVLLGTPIGGLNIYRTTPPRASDYALVEEVALISVPC